MMSNWSARKSSETALFTQVASRTAATATCTSLSFRSRSFLFSCFDSIHAKESFLFGGLVAVSSSSPCCSPSESSAAAEAAEEDRRFLSTSSCSSFSLSASFSIWAKSLISPSLSSYSLSTPSKTFLASQMQPHAARPVESLERPAVECD